MKPAKILIVDDNASLRMLLRHSLAPQNHQIFEAPNGTTALLLTTQLEPDLVLLDINMPDIDGVTVLQEIRKQNRWVGVLMISALNAVTWKQMAHKAGADGYLCKPCSVNEVQQQVTAMLALVSERRDHPTGCLATTPAVDMENGSAMTH